ncbi:MAG: phosphate-starvation-inducible PsiE family protein [Elainella sp. Prado103]|jgi:uncharacterized membrane protein (DUF373 family)|nr:phosphate-starvation-inducible PsiE family protein [Elainella sp. Prado103]
MESLRRLINHWFSAESNEQFLGNIKLVEAIVAKVLSIIMLGVLLIGLVDLCLLLYRDLFLSEPYGFFSTTLIEILGNFLNILIALEVLENITAYLRGRGIRIELVIVTALTAVARKIVIFDFTKLSGLELIGLAAAIFTLSISFWLVRRTNRLYNEV